MEMMQASVTPGRIARFARPITSTILFAWTVVSKNLTLILQVINLDRSVKRLLRMRERFQAIGLTFDRVAGLELHGDEVARQSSCLQHKYWGKAHFILNPSRITSDFIRNSDGGWDSALRWRHCDGRLRLFHRPPQSVDVRCCLAHRVAPCPGGR